MGSNLYFSTIPRNRMDMSITKTEGYGAGFLGDIRSGLALPEDYNNIKKEVLDQFMVSLIIHDEIYIDLDKVGMLARIIGYENFIILMKEKILKVINDEGIRPVIIKNDNSWSMNFNGQENYEEDFIRELITFGEYNVKIAEKLAYHAFIDPLHIPFNEIHSKLLKECEYDSDNKRYEKFIEAKDISIDEQINRVIRINEINKTLIIGSMTNISNIAIDSYSKQYLEMKISSNLPFVQLGEIQNVFKEISEFKKIPNLASLFINGSINIEDILELRNKVSGKKFRKWIFDNNYSEEIFIEKMMETKNISENIKNIKWGIVNSISLANSFAGLAASAADSYIVDKLLKGWSPNLFFDEVYGKRLKDIEYVFKMKANYKKVRKIYPELGPNDKCVCNSNKKFKKCCGKVDFR
ncbi:SEC-C domain-containing protein [Clostridium tagluense]|uniref:SEC-C metal-binding domain-containing protein n=1 Tax=Clostridium tagluense TaxID=360422 RepID=UPI001CF27A16|nr:SEC-C metal-binding domain-containing protein [Clostridium tagluense]MCB2313627.1 SEC-C domain-containing protein [Clostridium tagluense]MCB2318472.1 SEC-C domain-containing protein [Clostridium tagluense]MCB2323292.1 SEC-C domain-containing protein [Clostridium tagluense]MCB2328235.1 SEC-C domain-containing protein [Clostridium tagluense]MCB2332994.1 SEC-C domain-containing protein [Clostridium tagluense]